MARTSRRGKKSSGISVDLSGVDVGSKKAIPEGQYSVSVESATLEKSNNSGAQYIKLVLEVSEGEHKGYKLHHNCSLQPQALFNLKAVLLALGFDIPGKAFDLDLNDLVGSECIVEVSHELYEGKKKSRITDFIDPNEVDGEGDEGDEEEDLEELLQDLSLEELADLAKALKIKAAKIKKANTEEKLIELILDLDDEDKVLDKYDELFDDEDDENEEEEDSEDEEEDDDSEDDEEEDDDIDYSDMSLSELKAECKERGIKVKKGLKKNDIIAMLEEDDEE